ncbi:MAG TPA: aldose epimerase family protein [Streptosporangiaceae bacterium]|nr:aldose epimerase family protein [Streptosporangiaceae bacterium]
MRKVLLPRIARPAVRIGAAAALALGLGALAMSQASAAPAHNPCSPTVSRAPFGKTIEPYTGKLTQTYRYTLTNCRGMQIHLLSFGAITQSITVPGRNGREADVVLGFKTLQDYVNFDSPPVTANGGPYFGETIGRYGNRIAKGTFQLNGQTYTLPINNGVNSLHGGLVGFGDHVWSQAGGLISTGKAAGVTLKLVSPNGDSSGAAGSPGCPTGCTGYPAQITVWVTFTLNNADQYVIHYKAHNDSTTLSTVTNLTNHSYFNLAGEASPAGSAYSQFVQINADNYSPTDSTQIPLPLAHGVSVKGTPFDFRTPHTIGSRIDDVSAPDNVPASFASATGGKSQLLIAQGYDHNWILNRQTARTTGPLGLNLAARAFDPRSGRELTVWTDQPGVQFYSGNFLTGTLVGISGHTYRQGAGYTFETQHFPNSPNQPQFPSTVLGPQKTLNSTTIFAFSS